jgi:hypothetical protein
MSRQVVDPPEIAEERTADAAPAAPPAGERGAPSGTPGAARRRVVLFGALCLAAAAGGAGYVGLAARRAAPRSERAQPLPGVAHDAETRAAILGQPHVVFVDSDSGGTAYSRIAIAPLSPLDAPDRPRYVTDVECQRAYVAAGQGLGIVRNSSGVISPSQAFTFGTDFSPGRSVPQGGIPSRVRLSPDGRYGSITVFVAGHSYAEGGFSTQTTLFDVASGTALADLEQFTVVRDGARFESPDRNFWGVTFARGGDRFYATLGTSGTTYLVEGDLPGRQMRVLREGVECPSLSPDNTRLVFKKRVGNGPAVNWRLHRLDLATLDDAPLAETRNVDDQAEWLDDGHVLYALPDEGPPATIATNVWVVPVDGGGPPRLFLRQALSPAVSR